MLFFDHLYGIYIINDNCNIIYHPKYIINIYFLQRTNPIVDKWRWLLPYDKLTFGDHLPSLCQCYK